MTVAERLRLTIELTRFAEDALAALPPDERDRRLRILVAQKRAFGAPIERRLARIDR